MRKFAIRLAIVLVLPLTPLIAYGTTTDGPSFRKELRDLVGDLLKGFIEGKV